VFQHPDTLRSGVLRFNIRRELRVDAGSSSFGGGTCKARTHRDYEECRECSPRDPSWDLIRQPFYVGVSADHHHEAWPVLLRVPNH